MTANTFSLRGRITLRSTLAHGSFETGGTVTSFRREPVLQRDGAGNIQTDPYAIVVDDPGQREALRQYAQRLLKIIWHSKSDFGQWSYAQLADRVAVCARMNDNLVDFVADVIAKMRGALSVYGEDAEFLDRVLSAADNGNILQLLRQPGECLLIVTRMQVESAARYEKRPLPQLTGQMTLFDAPDEPEKAGAFVARNVPHIPLVPVYSGNAIRNGVVRRGAARFILNRFGWRVPMDSFRCLFSGGALVKTGEKGLDLTTRKALLSLMPVYGLLGGPFNRNDMVEGSCKPSKVWPIVREAKPTLPRNLWQEADILTMSHIMTVEAASRRDDAKMLASNYLSQRAVIGGDGDDAAAGSSMFYEREVMIAGTQLSSGWDFYQSPDNQIGAWISGWMGWAEKPFLGGISQQGHGRADVAYELDGKPFLTVGDGVVILSDKAQAHFDGYVAHLDTNKDAIASLLYATTTVVGEAVLTGLQDELELKEMD